MGATPIGGSIGIPTGIVLRSNTGLGAFTGAIGYAFLYYVLAMRLGKVLSATGAISPFVAAIPQINPCSSSILTCFRIVVFESAPDRLPDAGTCQSSNSKVTPGCWHLADYATTHAPAA